jgi:voltage-gated potassium channel
MDFAPQVQGLDVSMEQMEVSSESQLAGRELRELTSDDKRGLIVLALRRVGGKLAFNPPASVRIEAGDFLIVMGERPMLRKMESMLDPKNQSKV